MVTPTSSTRPQASSSFLRRSGRSRYTPAPRRSGLPPALSGRRSRWGSFPPPLTWTHPGRTVSLTSSSARPGRAAGLSSGSTSPPRRTGRGGGRRGTRRRAPGRALTPNDTSSRRWRTARTHPGLRPGAHRVALREFLRRPRRWADAHAHLRRAPETFECLDAQPWLERTTPESCGRPANRSPGATPTATGRIAQEWQVASWSACA